MSDYLHCIVQKRNGYWSAKCLDFTLYSVGETKLEAIEKLGTEINEFLFESLEGIDKAHAPQLLLRKAPLNEWVVFYLLKFRS